MKILKTKNPYYEAMKKGEGKLTGRTSDYMNMNAAEKILIQLVDDNNKPVEGEKFEAEIKKITKYHPPQGIEEACRDFGTENLLKGVKSVEEAVKIYHSFPDYEKRIKEKGFIVIEIK